MRQRKTMSALVVVAAVLLLSVAYAAITNITLNISGNITLTPDQIANFSVRFTGTPTYIGSGTGDVQITGATSGIVNISGLSKVGDKGTATFMVQNISSDNMAAYLSATTTTGNNSAKYIDVDYSFDTTTLFAGETTNLKVVVELVKLPETQTKVTIGVDITASTENGTIENIIGGNTIGCSHEYGSYSDWSSNGDGTMSWYLISCDCGASNIVMETKACYDNDNDGYCDECYGTLNPCEHTGYSNIYSWTRIPGTLTHKASHYCDDCGAWIRDTIEDCYDGDVDEFGNVSGSNNWPDGSCDDCGGTM